MERPSSCFLHIPKTGGSWVADALRRAFSPDHLYEVPSADVGRVPVAQLLTRYAAVTGHFTMDHLRSVVGQTFIFTFLRHPLDRVLSLYYFYREQHGGGRLDHRVAEVQAHDFERFVQRLTTRVSPWSNWQTYVFSGVGHCESPPEELLPLALENLERIDFVGTQDALGEGLAVLASMRGWPLAPSPHRVNATKHREPVERLPPAALARLEDLNRCDLELFRIAQQRWRDRRGRSHATRTAPAAAGSHVDRREMGTREVVITAAAVDVNRRTITVSARSTIAEDDLTVGIRITDASGVEVHGTNTRLLGQRLQAAPGQTITVDFRLAIVLVPGTYSLTVAAHRGTDHLEGCFHWIDNLTRFDLPRENVW
jgi:hypothetical protein